MLIGVQADSRRSGERSSTKHGYILQDESEVTPGEIITLILAVYGAVLSSIIGIRELMKDRRRIAVTLEYVAFIERAQIIITNIGFRPISITEIGMSVQFEQPQGSGWEDVPRNSLFGTELGEEPFPVTLGDGDHLSLPLSDVVGHRLLENGMQARITVYDSEANEYTKFRTRTYNPKWGSYSKKE